jgi:DNA ligase-1
MYFDDFSQKLAVLEQTASRLDMTELLAQLYLQLDTDELAQTMYLLQGSLVPEYRRLEFQLSITMVIKALAQIRAAVEQDAQQDALKDAQRDALKDAQQDDQRDAVQSQSLFDYEPTAENLTAENTTAENFTIDNSTGLKSVVQESTATEALALEPTAQETLALESLKKVYKKVGDIGILAEQTLQVLRESCKGPREAQKKISILEVYTKLVAIAKESGSGSQQRKLQLLQDLLTQVSTTSAKFIVRIVVGKLRLGFSSMTMIDALSWAAHSSKEDSKLLEAAFNRRADIGFLAQEYLALKSDFAAQKKLLKSIKAQVGVPVVPALCQRLNSAQEIIDKLGNVIAEPKYDGLRIQIHLQKNSNAQTISAFTRNLDDISHMFPELQQAFTVFSAESLILDGEAIGYDHEAESLRSFQETITRRRKHDVENMAQKIPIRFYLYDIMYKDGQSLLDTPLQERKDILYQLLNGQVSSENAFQLTPYIVTKDPVVLRTFHEEQLAAGFEGAVVKKVAGPYVSGRKGWQWVKIKEEEGTTGKLADTIDCVVMGYYAGKGKRAQFGIGALLVGVRDEETDKIVTVAKIGTGLSEAQLVTIKKMCDELQTPENSVPNNFVIPKELLPDVLTTPDLVLEIAADEITNSPLHSAGQALRFPRLISIRSDKSAQQATTKSELAQLKIEY